MLNRRIVASKSNTNLFISHSPLPCWWRRCRLSILIIPQGRGEVKRKWMKSWRCHDEILASSDEIFSLRLQMKLNPPISPAARQISSRSDFIHRRWISSANGGFNWKKPSAFANGFFLVILLQNRSVSQVFSKSIRVLRQADRLIPWRWWVAKSFLRKVSNYDGKRSYVNLYSSAMMNKKANRNNPTKNDQNRGSNYPYQCFLWLFKVGCAICHDIHNCSDQAKRIKSWDKC